MGTLPSKRLDKHIRESPFGKMRTFDLNSTVVCSYPQKRNAKNLVNRNKQIGIIVLEQA